MAAKESRPLLDAAVFGEDVHEVGRAESKEDYKLSKPEIIVCGDGSNALVLMPRKGQKRKVPREQQQKQAKLQARQKKYQSTRQQRKLKQLLEKHRDNDLKTQLSEELQKHQLHSAAENAQGAGEGRTAEGLAGEGMASRKAESAPEATEEVRLANAQLLLGSSDLHVLTGVKGRRLQKKAQKLMRLQQHKQKRQKQLQQQQEQQQQLQQTKNQMTDQCPEASKANVPNAATHAAKRKKEPRECKQQKAVCSFLAMQDEAYKPEHKPVIDDFRNEPQSEAVAAGATKTKKNGKSAPPTAKAAATPPAAPAARRGLPKISYNRQRAASFIERPLKFEACRASLPAAEVEGRVVSFLLQQDHPSAHEADDEGSSLEEERSVTVAAGLTVKSRKRKNVDLSRCRHADVLCVSGATGSGKSTQIPQFVFESGICYPTMLFSSSCAAASKLVGNAQGKGPSHDADPAAASLSADPGLVSAEETKDGICVKRQLRICVTQPRRVAAVALAGRVAEEMGAPKLVGYQIRHDKHNVGPQCRLKFATDGVLLREMKDDFLCSKYCCIIIDEAHERSVNVDLLLGLLSRVVVLRRQRYLEGVDTIPPLKILVMSATLEVANFTENKHLFFPSPALLSLESRTFEVRIHFSKKTATRYVDAAVKKALQIHTRLPAGSVLVFLTGRAEVLEAVRQLQEWQTRRETKYAGSRSAPASTGKIENEETGSEADFVLSDPSDEDPLPFDAEHSQDFDSDTFVYSGNSDSAQPSHNRAQTQIDRFSQTLQLALESDTEEEEASHEDARGTEALVTQTILLHSRPKTRPAVKQTECPRAAAPPGAIPLKAISATEAATKRQNSVASGDVITNQDAPGGAPEGPDAAEAFDGPDTSKRRLRQTVFGVGWLGAGVYVRKSTTVENKGKNKATQERREKSGASDLAHKSPEDTLFVPRLTALPLYATLPSELQKLAFEPPAFDERRIIVATNVAETSLTLPNVRYIVDSGREKKRVFASGSDCFSYFTVTLTSQAAAQQRTGRAGRVGAGVCYRLYSSSVYTHEMEPYPPPQIQSVPLDYLLLYMAALGIPWPCAFPFPSPPPAAALATARDRLVALGALESKRVDKPNRKHQQLPLKENEVCCTVLGHRMSELPIPPRFAKMLLLACSRQREFGSQFVALACYLVAALSVGDVLLPSKPDGLARRCASPAREGRPSKQPWEEYDSDIDAYIWLCGAYSHARDPISFCRSYLLDPSRLAEIAALAAQLAQLLYPLLRLVCQHQEGKPSATPSRGAPDLDALNAPLRLELPSPEARRSLHQCVVQGLIDHVATWQDPPRLPLDATKEQCAASRGGYRCAELKGQLALPHPSSNILHIKPRPKLIIYNQLLHDRCALLQVCTPVDAADLSASDTSLVQHAFLQVPPPVYDEKRDAVVGWSRPTYLPLQLQLPAVERPLPRIKVAAGVPVSMLQQQQQQSLYACFAAAIVSGRAVPRLKQFVPSLAVTPEGMLAGSRAGTFAVRAFVEELARRDTASRSELVKVWKSDPKYLSGEFIALLRSYNYDTLQDIRDMWPPL